jgi:hypothetical protein
MPWHVVSIVWPAIVAALLPLDLANVIARLPYIITRLRALARVDDHQPDHERSRPRQVDDFRSRFILPARKAA